MNSIDQQFVEYVVKSLVSKPDLVKIERRIDEKGVLLELTVDPDDLGRVIGKHGATAQSIRTLLRALGTKNDARYNLKIIDNGPTDRQYEPRDQQTSRLSNQETETESSVTESPIVNPVDETDVEADEESSASRYSQTRRELEEMDDLDV